MLEEETEAPRGETYTAKETEESKHSAIHCPPRVSCLCPGQTLLIDHRTLSRTPPHPTPRPHPHPDPPLPQSPSPPQFMRAPGLAFPAFSQAVTLLPGAPFWAFVFFLTMFMMQLTTLVNVVESIVLPLQNTISFITKQPALLPGTVEPRSRENPVLLPSRPPPPARRPNLQGSL